MLKTRQTNDCRCGEMADAQDLKSWGRKKPCGFESHHRHHEERLQSAKCKMQICAWMVMIGLSVCAHAAVVRTWDGTSYEGQVFLEPGNKVLVALNDSTRKSIPLANVRTATFTSSESSLAHFGQLAEGWTNIDVGDVTIPGTAGQSNRLFAVRVGGGEIGEHGDSFHFAYFRAYADVDLIARVISIDGADRLASAGVMFRDSLKPDAKFVFAAVSGTGEISVQERSGTGWKGASKPAVAKLALPCWLKLSRWEKTYRAYVSTNGTHWQPIGVDGLDLKESCYGGLAVASHGTLAVCTALIDGVSRTVSGVRAEYFADANFQNLKTNRVEPTVNFIWSGNAPPADGLPANNFSVRWTGELKPKYSEPYLFHYDAGDAQLWVNDQLLPHVPLIRQTRDPKAPAPVPLLLKADTRYAFKFELRQTAGAGLSRLAWSSPSQGIEILPTKRLFCTVEARSRPGARVNVTNQWVMGRGIMLRDGSFVTGKVRSVTDAGVKFTYRDENEHLLPVHQVARAVFRVSPRNAILSNADLAAGILLDNGDFIEGALRIGNGRSIKVSSVLLGLRSYDLENSGVAALVFAAPTAGLGGAYQLRLSDNSVVMAKSLTVEQDQVSIVEPLLGTFRVPREAVTEIRAGERELRDQKSIRSGANRSDRGSPP
jgi:hypothetical protein